MRYQSFARLSFQSGPSPTFLGILTRVKHEADSAHSLSEQFPFAQLLFNPVVHRRPLSTNSLRLSALAHVSPSLNDFLIFQLSTNN